MKGDPAKIKVIIELPPPKKHLGTQRASGLPYIYLQVYLELSKWCQPFSRLTKDEQSLNGTNSVKKQSIKVYLTKSPVLASLNKKPLMFCVVPFDQSLRTVMAQEKPREDVLYYLSWTLVGPKERYSSNQKGVLSLIFVIQKLLHFASQLYHKSLFSKVDTFTILN